MQNRVKFGKITFALVFVFLSCYFMQLFNFPNVLTIFIGGSLCLVMMIEQRKIRLDVETVLLILSMATYFIIIHGARGITMSLPYAGIVIYVLAHYLTYEAMNNKVNSEKYLLFLVFAIVIGYSLHGIINSYLFLDGQLQEGDIRHWMDIWEKWYLPGTWQVIFFLPAFAFVFPAIIYFKRRKIMNVLIFLTSVLFIYIGLASQTRTPILAFPIVFVAQIVLYLILEREKVDTLAKNRKVQIAAGIIILALIAVVIALLNHPLVASFISIMGRDGGILNNIRFKIHREGLKQLFVYPMGGYQMDFLGRPHAHNTWIDIADAAGVIPFFLFVSYTFLTVYELIVWLTKKEISVERKLMVSGLYGIFFLYYTVERGLGGSMHYMTPWYFVNAMVHGELTMIKKQNNNKQ